MMDDGAGTNGVDRAMAEGTDPSAEAEGARRPAGPTWRAWLISILAAIVLSVAATLILGGSFRAPVASNGAAADNGAGRAGSCCPAQADGAR